MNSLSAVEQLRQELLKCADPNRDPTQQPQQSEEDFLKCLILAMKQRDQDIESLEQQLAKSKSELTKTTKQLQELQDKCSMGAANSNNTGSSFMLPAEFKIAFEQFMQQTITTAFTDLLHRPKSCAFLLQETLQLQYGRFEKELDSLLQQVASLLHMKSSQATHKLLFSQLLKPLQDNYTVIVPFDSKYSIRQLELIVDGDEEMLAVIRSSDFEESLAELHKLIAYMLLQENRWEFVMPRRKLIEYSKKEHTCVDGWIKEQQKAIMLVEGIRRPTPTGNYILHQQLRNFVLPCPDESEHTPKAKQLSEPMASETEKEDSQLAKIPEAKPPQRSLATIATVAIQLMPRCSLKQSLSVNLTDRSSVECVNSIPQPSAAAPIIKMKELLESLPLKKSSHQQVEAKKKRSGASRISGLLTDPSFSEELLVTKRQQKKDESKLDAEFESRIVNRQIRSGTALTRNIPAIKKEKSAGRIVHQVSKASLKEEPAVGGAGHPQFQTHSRCLSNKENHNLNNKEAGYMEIILSKFREEKGNFRSKEGKKPITLLSDIFPSKTDRHDKQESRRRQQNRPLKPSLEHMQRVREKHHLLY